MNNMELNVTLVIIGILLGGLLMFVKFSNEVAHCYVTGEVDDEKYVLTVNVGQCQEVCDLLEVPTLYHKKGASCWQGNTKREEKK